MNRKPRKTAASDDAKVRAAKRSAIMRAVKSRDTRPELLLRTMLRSIKTGYRLHRADLPGKPDVVYGPRRLAIFMHGCFWHGHDCKRGARAPKENAAYWSGKIARNRARDAANLAALAALGWRTLVVFECALKDRPALERRLRAALKKAPAIRSGSFGSRPAKEYGRTPAGPAN
jgi:DNA mismatch endonuclease (patch repair protein)